ncbi:MAG: Arm DNA-binding domain-containing protein [Methylococcaceae bacterium]|jgi:Arm DNA-binding domain
MANNINKDEVYRAAKSKEKDYMINDGGLYFFVGKNGARLWRFVYTFDKNRKKLALGIYPGITLEAARRKSEEARGSIENGIDPGKIRSEQKKPNNWQFQILIGLVRVCQY